jgi:hypothetical protein
LIGSTIGFRLVGKRRSRIAQAFIKNDVDQAMTDRMWAMERMQYALLQRRLTHAERDLSPDAPAGRAACGEVFVNTQSPTPCLGRR